MRSPASGAPTLLALAALLVALLVADEPCPRLRDQWRGLLAGRAGLPVPPAAERTVKWWGHELEVQVWGGGGAERAAAAALFVVLHYLLGYAARLRHAPADLCHLAAADHPASVAPAAAWPAARCAAERWSLDELTSLTAGAAAPIGPLLLAYAPNAACAERAASWRFFLDASAARACRFLPAGDPGNATDRSAARTEFYEVLARNESERDARTLAALRARVERLPFSVKSFDTDFLLRKEIFEYREKKNGFLFFDDDIWCEEPLVTRVRLPPAPCADRAPRGALRVGAGRFMRRYAPPVASAVARLDLSGAELRAVLDLETRRARPGIVDATCSWWSVNVEKLLDFLVAEVGPAPPAYSIAIYVCHDDPDVDKYAEAAAVVHEGLRGSTGDMFRYDSYPTDCSDADALRRQLLRRAGERTAAGAVAWATHAGVRAAAADATRTRLPLMLVGPAAGAALGPLVRAASGRVEDLARAYRHLLLRCRWSRLALLSDGSALAGSFEAALLAGQAYACRVVMIDARNVSTALVALRAADPRVILVNANWKLSAAAACAGRRLGMLPEAGYAWLAREWRGGCAVPVLSLGMAWRGGGAPADSRWQTALRARWAAARGAIVANDAASLVDALLQLVGGFENFLKEFPSDRYDLRGDAGNIGRSFDGTNVKGVAQNLTSENDSLKDPLVYVERWVGNHGVVVDAWRVTRGAVDEAGGACAAWLGVAPVADRRVCLAPGAGPAFAPRCHDAAAGAGVALALAAGAALLAARSARRRRLLRRDLALMAALLERRRRTASTLVAYLVDRGAVRLLYPIGAGSYGRVHFAELRRAAGAALPVAAKEPREGAAPAEEDEFLREACVLAPLAHAHVVRLVGVCVADGPPLLLMEHALHLDLRRYLLERRAAGAGSPELAAEALTRLAREAAAALEYLAERRVVHRDVRAANCLVDEARSLKLADFGLARALDGAEPDYATTRRGLFPVLWMAPESLQDGLFSAASDVWALGVLLLELATLGARPFGGWALPRVLRHVVAGGHPPLSADLCEDTRALVLQCWRRAPGARPSAASVRAQLLAAPRAVRAGP